MSGPGKGSKRRPSNVSQDEYAKNWERAFRATRGRRVVSRHAHTVKHAGSIPAPAISFDLRG